MRERKLRIKQLKIKSKIVEEKQEVKPTPNITGYFTGDLTLDLDLVRQEIQYNSDVHFREFYIGRTGIRAAIIFVEGLSDKDLIDTHIMKSLMLDFNEEFKHAPSYIKDTVSKEFIINHVLSISEIKEGHSIKEVMSKV